MGSKASPGKFDCWHNAEPDEPLFVLLARDRHAPTLVWLWAVLRELDEEDTAKVKEARECAVAMIDWAVKHGRKVVGLGHSVLAGVLELIRGANQAVKEAGNEMTTVEQVREFLAHCEFEKGPV
jgi:hypothetical protein